MTIFKTVELETKPTTCPFCDAAIVNEYSSESGLSFFARYACGLELADQSAVQPRRWRNVVQRDCAFVYQRFLELKETATVSNA